MNIDNNSSVRFNNSHINFERNNGYICGGVSVRNSNVLMGNVSISFLGNYGGKTSALVLFNSHFTASGGTSVNQTDHCLFTGNSGSAIFSSRSDLNLREIEMEFINNSIK